MLSGYILGIQWDLPNKNNWYSPVLHFLLKILKNNHKLSQFLFISKQETLESLNLSQVTLENYAQHNLTSVLSENRHKTQPNRTKTKPTRDNTYSLKNTHFALYTIK